MNVVLNRTVVVDSVWRFDNLCSSHLQSQNELYHVTWWYKTLVIDLIGQLSRDVVGRLSVKPWCYWLWRLVMSLVPFDPSIITVKQSFIVSQIVVILSALLFFAVILSWCCTLRGYAVTLKFVPVVNTPCSASFTQEIYRLLNLSCDSKFRDDISVAVMSNGRFITGRSGHRSSYIFRRWDSFFRELNA